MSLYAKKSVGLWKTGAMAMRLCKSESRKRTTICEPTFSTSKNVFTPTNNPTIETKMVQDYQTSTAVINKNNVQKSQPKRHMDTDGEKGRHEPQSKQQKQQHPPQVNQIQNTTQNHTGSGATFHQSQISARQVLYSTRSNNLLVVPTNAKPLNGYPATLYAPVQVSQNLGNRVLYRSQPNSFASTTGKPIDQFDATGIYVACKLRGLAKNQRIKAEKLIHDALFKAEMNSL